MKKHNGVELSFTMEPTGVYYEGLAVVLHILMNKFPSILMSI